MPGLTLMAIDDFEFGFDLLFANQGMQKRFGMQPLQPPVEAGSS